MSSVALVTVEPSERLRLTVCTPTLKCAEPVIRLATLRLERSPSTLTKLASTGSDLTVLGASVTSFQLSAIAVPSALLIWRTRLETSATTLGTVSWAAKPVA